MQLGQYPAPRHTLAHLSDTHLLAAGQLQYGVADPEPGLRLALERLARLDPPPQALVFTGDLADRGEPEAYRRLRELVEPAAAAFGAQVIWVMGNHDDRATFGRELLGTDGDGAAGDRPHDAVHDVDGLRIVSLDTSVPGYHHGALSDDQLDWLADVLATPAPHGSVLAMHHPPIALPMAPVDAIIELLDQDRLAAVLAGSDVRQILSGHLHYSTYATFAGIPVSVASASCYTIDPAPKAMLLAGVDGGQSITMTHLYDREVGTPGGMVVNTVVPLAEAPPVYAYPAALTEQLLALSEEERRELISRKDSPFQISGLDAVLPGGGS